MPALPSAADLRGLNLFLGVLARVHELNPGLELVGVIVTQFDSRLNSHNQALAALLQAGVKMLMPVVPRSVRVQESSGARQPLTTYDPKGRAAQAYRELTEEVEKWLNQNKTSG